MKKTWSAINTLLHRDSKNNKLITALKDPNITGTTYRDPRTIANKLNSHFATIGQQLANKLPLTEYNYNYYLNKMKSEPNSFLFEPVNAKEVEMEILCLQQNKCYGLYSCPTKLLKLARGSISHILASIINLSILTGKYPTKLKKAKVIPVYKSEDPEEANNYRPISLLSNVTKSLRN